MARPQNSELRRSGTTAAFEPDTVSSRLDAHTRPTSSGEGGPVPEDNSPGHRPEHDQDKPDLDAFAARFSGHDLDDLPTETGLLRDTDAAVDARTGVVDALRRWAVPVAGFALLAALVTLWARRRRA